MNAQENSEIDSNENKVLLIGESNVGKTSIVTRVCSNTFNSSTKPTIGSDLFQKELTFNGNTVRLNIWDTAGQERFRGISSSYYKSAKIALIVFDLTNLKSFEKVNFWKDEITNFADKDFFIILVGNKSDLIAERVVKKEMAEELVKKHSFKAYYETSAKNGDSKEIGLLFDYIASKINEVKPSDGKKGTGLLNNGELRENVDGENGPNKEKKCCG